MNKHFHSEERGCDIVLKDFKIKHKKADGTIVIHIIHGGFCRTHKKDLCRCGYVWGIHGGTSSRDLPGLKPSDKRRVFKRGSINKKISNLKLPSEKYYKIVQEFNKETGKFNVIHIDKEGKRFSYDNGKLSTV